MQLLAPDDKSSVLFGALEFGLLDLRRVNVELLVELESEIVHSRWRLLSESLFRF